MNFANFVSLKKDFFALKQGSFYFNNYQK